MLNVMHSSKAAGSALCVQISLKLIFSGLCCSALTLLLPALLIGTSVQVMQLCQQCSHNSEHLRNSLHNFLVRNCPTFQYQGQTVRCCSLYLILNVKYALEQTGTAGLFPYSLACHFERLYSFLHCISATIEQIGQDSFDFLVMNTQRCTHLHGLLAFCGVCGNVAQINSLQTQWQLEQHRFFWFA